MSRWTDREILDFLDHYPPSGFRWECVSWPPYVIPRYVSVRGTEKPRTFRQTVSKAIDDMKEAREREERCRHELDHR